MSDFWNKPKSLREIADDISTGLPDDEIGDDAMPNAARLTTDAPMEEVRITGNIPTDDPWTNKAIQTLHPAIRNDVARFINAVKDRTGQQLRVGSDSAFRTIQQQDEDYAKGRTAPGKRVTNAAGGQSYHNYGLGFDIAGLNGKDITYDLPYPAIADIGREHGFEWGGNWQTFQDRPHFQRTYGYTPDQLRNMVGPDSQYPAIANSRVGGGP